MKKRKIRKLELNRETLRNLVASETHVAHGGISTNCPFTDNTCYSVCETICASNCYSCFPCGV